MAIKKKNSRTSTRVRRTSSPVRATPAFVTPMAAQAVKRLPGGDEWTYELKFDGYRALAPQDGHHDWIKSEAGRLDRLLSSLKNAPQESSVEGDGQSAGLGSPPPVAIVTASVSAE
jgi:hypothetical protein